MKGPVSQALVTAGPILLMLFPGLSSCGLRPTGKWVPRQGSVSCTEEVPPPPADGSLGALLWGKRSRQSGSSPFSAIPRRPKAPPSCGHRVSEPVLLVLLMGSSVNFSLTVRYIFTFQPSNLTNDLYKNRELKSFRESLPFVSECFLT